MYLYSKSLHAMYLESINYPDLPADVIKVSKDEYKQYWTGKPPEGKQLKRNTYPFKYELILGQFESLVDGVVITDTQAQYEYEVLQVSSTRASLYREMVDPLRAEASSIRRIEGDDAKAEEYEAQADAAYKKIRADNPWPELPV
ncbi:hypothetical protein KW448_07015 [Vibrio fluvialis]|nr:hypothetical protein [Vibrio fluvialis]